MTAVCWANKRVRNGFVDCINLKLFPRFVCFYEKSNLQGLRFPFNQLPLKKGWVPLLCCQSRKNLLIPLNKFWWFNWAWAVDGLARSFLPFTKREIKSIRSNSIISQLIERASLCCEGNFVFWLHFNPTAFSSSYFQV